MELLTEFIPVILTGILIIAGAYMFRKIGDSERERGKFEAKYEYMVRINRERTDELNALNAELQRKNEYIARLEKERETVRYFISSFGLNMKKLGWLCLDNNNSQK